ncbi:MAG: alkaline phosphatase family protein [Verrucomicrobia bacterium]|nr:alkaline phosphatase family protein [Verrucomicrobiota bacterium]
MLNEKSIKAISATKKPLYDTYCFSQIPATIQRLLGVGKGGLPLDCTGNGSYDLVVLILIDAFGWKFFEKYRDKYPFLSRFLTEGIASKITSQFPSTTAAHITTLATGLEVGQSGVFEWFYYEPILDTVIAPLLFSHAGEKNPDTLCKEDIDPKEIFALPSVFKQMDVPSFVFHPQTIASSAYSKTFFQGTIPTAHKQFVEGLDKLNDLLKRQDRGYFYIYFPDIDSEAHRHGLESKQVYAALDRCFLALETFYQRLPSKKIALAVTADHGMTSIDPKKTYFLNKEIPGIESFFKCTKAGKPIVPGGSSRDFFLYVKEDKLKELKELLTQRLKPIADVVLTKDLIDQGFFGSRPPSDVFLSRVGNLVILPHAHESVWWYQKGKFEQKFFAMHGGLSPEELESIFLFMGRD